MSRGTAGDIEYANWLGEGILLLVGTFDVGRENAADLSVLKDGQPEAIASRSLSYRGDDGVAPGRTVLVAFLPRDVRTLGSLEGLVVKTPQATLNLTSGDLRAAFTDLKALARRSFAPLGTPTRTTILEFLATTLSEALPEARALEMSESLFGLREALRERLPTTPRDQNRVLVVNTLMAVDSRSFYIGGWMRARKADTARLTAVSPEGHRVELLEKLSQLPRSHTGRYSSGRGRPDASFVFISFFELPAPSLLSAGWVVEMETAEGEAVEVAAPSVQRGLTAVRSAILNDPFTAQALGDELDYSMANHVSPAVSRIQEQASATVEIETVVQYGSPPPSPEVSIVVPLYQRIDLLENQLAEFADDPEIHAADLIYVLDSPEQNRELLDLAARLFPIYRVPLRVAVLGQNAGYAGANNAGASLAQGRLLFLLNSDVLPDRPGWLEGMRAFYDATPNIGALGPKLLYEDDSIQHAGIYFHRRPGSSVWRDAHYFKGLHRTFPAANVARPVPVVSGACLLIDRELYDQVGGLRNIYVQGDYEDADLCMRMMEGARQNWYLPAVELYHLEALSYQSNLRLAANRYNGWLHTHLWHDRIAALMEEHEVAVGSMSSATEREIRYEEGDLTPARGALYPRPSGKQ
jgi:GT2 family glycosyltransferase